MSGILSTLANCLPSREKPYCGGPSVRIGVLGGGQLGRMMIQDAIDLDARVEVMDPSASVWKSTSESGAPPRYRAGVASMAWSSTRDSA